MRIDMEITPLQLLKNTKCQIETQIKANQLQDKLSPWQPRVDAHLKEQFELETLRLQYKFVIELLELMDALKVSKITMTLNQLKDTHPECNYADCIMAAWNSSSFEAKFRALDSIQQQNEIEEMDI